MGAPVFVLLQDRAITQISMYYSLKLNILCSYQTWRSNSVNEDNDRDRSTKDM